MDLQEVLKTLAAWPEGISESMLRAHGVQSSLLGELIGAQLATAKVERVWEDGQEIELTRIRITGKGWLALARASPDRSGRRVRPSRGCSGDKWPRGSGGGKSLGA